MQLTKNKISIALLVLIIAAFAAGGSAFSYYQYKKLRTIGDKLSSLETDFRSLEKNSQSAQSEFNNLVEKTKSMKQQVDSLVGSYAKLANRPPEIIRQEIVRQKSQDQLLTEAVSNVAPSVVSIVVSKDVPKLEVVYTNPFGNDPFFKDFNVQVPTYRQIGTENKKIGAGTGFLISKNGYIVTNKHVVADDQATYTALLADGTQKAAQIIYKDAAIDAAIIKIDGNDYKYASLGNSDSLKLGQSVFAIGNALGEYGNSVSTGIVSGLNRDIQASSGGGAESLKGVIQTDAAINPGNSGGPLVTLDSEVIGVNVATVIGSNNISFSIPINAIKGIMQANMK